MKPLYKNIGTKQDGRSKVFLFDGIKVQDVCSGQVLQASSPAVGLKYGYFEKSSFRQVRSTQGRKLLNTVGKWLHLTHRWQLELTPLIQKYDTVENFSRAIFEQPCEVTELPLPILEQIRQSFSGDKSVVGRFSIVVKGVHEASAFENLSRRLETISFSLLYEGGRVFKLEGPKETYEEAVKSLKDAFPLSKPL